MASSTWKFIRHNDVNGFLSANRPSTDAISALEAWCSNCETGSRAYEQINISDDYIEAKLTYNDNDHESGNELDKYCFNHGVKRVKIS